MTNLADHTIRQLKQLSTRIAKEIEKRELNTKAHLLKRLRRLAKDEGFALKDIVGDSGAEPAEKPPVKRRNKSTTVKASASKSKGPLKYRNPNDLTQGWSGRGRRPRWVESWLASGGTLDALENAAASARQKGKAGTATTAAPTESAAPPAQSV